MLLRYELIIFMPYAELNQVPFAVLLRSRHIPSTVHASFKVPTQMPKVELGFHIYYPLCFSPCLLKRTRRGEDNKLSAWVYFQGPSLRTCSIDQQFSEQIMLMPAQPSSAHFFSENEN